MLKALKPAFRGIATRVGTALAASIGTLWAISPTLQHNLEVALVALGAVLIDVVAEKVLP